VLDAILMTGCGGLDTGSKQRDRMEQPYRPLYVIDRERPHPTGCSNQEVRGLALLLIVLGGLRIVPAIAAGESLRSESSVAVIMLALGTAIVARLHCHKRLRGAPCSRACRR